MGWCTGNVIAQRRGAGAEGQTDRKGEEEKEDKVSILVTQYLGGFLICSKKALLGLVLFFQNPVPLIL